MNAVGVATQFVDAINRGDIDALASLMTDDHELRVFDELPLTGRAANIEAWRGYASAFPAYRIYVDATSTYGTGLVALLGSTTGSHLGLPDAEERTQTLIWLASVRGDQCSVWQLVEDTAAARTAYGLAPAAPPR